MASNVSARAGKVDRESAAPEATYPVPLHEYRMLAALRERASAAEIEEAEIDAAIAEHAPGLNPHGLRYS